VLCELIPIRQVPLLAIGPCSAVTVLFPTPTSLVRKVVLVLPSSVVL
jgi:hypothetical protein